MRSARTPRRGHARVNETHGLTSSRQQFLDVRRLPEPRHGRDGTSCLGGRDDELRAESRSLPSVGEPGLAGFDHRRESDLRQRHRQLRRVAHDDLARDMKTEPPRYCKRLLLVDRDSQGALVGERQANARLEPCAMCTQQGDRGVA